MSNLPDPYFWISLCSIFTLLPAQVLMNKANARIAPQAPVNDRFTGANIAVIVVGGLVIVLAIIGTVAPLMPDDAPAEEQPNPKARRSEPVVFAPAPPMLSRSA